MRGFSEGKVREVEGVMDRKMENRRDRRTEGEKECVREGLMMKREEENDEGDSNKKVSG